jgi:excisionase family DNA binding protein
MTSNDLLTPDDVASRLGVAVPTVLKWIRRGRFRAYRCSRKTIRLDWTDVLAAIRTPVGDTTNAKAQGSR